MSAGHTYRVGRDYFVDNAALQVIARQVVVEPMLAGYQMLLDDAVVRLTHVAHAPLPEQNGRLYRCSRADGREVRPILRALVGPPSAEWDEWPRNVALQGCGCHATATANASPEAPCACKLKAGARAGMLDDAELRAALAWLSTHPENNEATLKKIADLGQRLGLNLNNFQANEVWRQLLGEELQARVAKAEADATEHLRTGAIELLNALSPGSPVRLRQYDTVTQTRFVAEVLQVIAHLVEGAGPNDIEMTKNLLPDLQRVVTETIDTGPSPT